ncbi:MAG: hypothetical protein ACTS6P_01840 [Candidatus Hodgkinia cicadicola]
MTGRSTFPRSAISEGGIIFTVAQSFQQIWTTFECEAFESPPPFGKNPPSSSAVLVSSRSKFRSLPSKELGNFRLVNHNTSAFSTLQS